MVIPVYLAIQKFFPVKIFFHNINEECLCTINIKNYISQAVLIWYLDYHCLKIFNFFAGSHIVNLMKQENYLVSNCQDILLLLLCSNPSAECYFGQCQECQKTKILDDRMREVFDEIHQTNLL